MQIFQYKAKEGPAKIIEGTIEAESADNAIQKIMHLGFTPIDVSPVISVSVKTGKSKQRASSLGFSFFKKISFNEVVVFTRQISDLVDASISVLRSLKIVAEQTKNQKFKEVILSMHSIVRDGGSFSDALLQNQDIFSSLYVGMVRTGEGGGGLSVVLERLAVYLEKEQENRSKIRASLAYPSLILIVGFITIFVLLAFVIPRLSIMFDDLNQTLPLPTLLLVNISNVFGRLWWLILGLIGFGIAAFRKWINSGNGRSCFDSIILKIPFFSEFIKTIEVERFARTLATQIETGVSITEALDSAIIVISNLQLRNELKSVSVEVANGDSLRASLTRTEFFPQMAVNMISVGEETGRLEKGLYKVADTYSRQADQTTKTLISLLGPLVLIVIVTLVGFVVIAMLLPIFQMNLLIE
ncbi:MAG: type II secretion system F family protein [Candidatus Omnitrophica bacterium]|nr:type II secretion system F family protein [Candidatus Omnitrophota bacterium]MBU1996512.1 type II secretion system F family protein [Candidatus Omnitrophota bacterium]